MMNRKVFDFSRGTEERSGAARMEKSETFPFVTTVVSDKNLSSQILSDPHGSLDLRSVRDEFNSQGELNSSPQGRGIEKQSFSIHGTSGGRSIHVIR